MKMLKSLSSSIAALTGAALIAAATTASAYHIGNRVWLDTNQNGIQDEGEVGVNGITVNIRRCADNSLVGTQTTGDTNITQFYPPLTNVTTSPNFQGGYNLDLGQDPINHQVYVEVILPAGYAFSPSNVGSDRQVDSDIDPATGKSSCVIVDCGNPDPYGCVRIDIDAGIYQIPTGNGTGTPGYWKNHPEAWCSDTITLGGVTYTKAQAIAIMQLPTKKDKTLNLAEHLIAAILNVNCNETDASCVQAAIDAAQLWLGTNPIGSKVGANSAAWAQISGSFSTLANYNEGLLCAPHRD